MMNLSDIRTAKESGWSVVLFEAPHADSEGDPVRFYVLLTPGSQPVGVSEKAGYGSKWGDFSEQEAWERLESLS